MAGINQGTPEAAIGEPIRLGSSEEFEIEQHPISDRLIIRDTVNGKVAYVRKERGGQIGGDGVLIKALKESKPMADDGRTYDTIQQAERAASSWVFVPPGTFNEKVEIETDGLTIKGSGYNTIVDSTSQCFVLYADGVTLSDIHTQASGATGIELRGKNQTVKNSYATGGMGLVRRESGSESASVLSCYAELGSSGRNVITVPEKSIIANCTAINNTGGGTSVVNVKDDSIVANNVIDNCDNNGIYMDAFNAIAIGNRVANCSNNGLRVIHDDNIVANNRISDSGASDISDSGTGTLLDSNLTGASN